MKMKKSLYIRVFSAFRAIFCPRQRFGSCLFSEIAYIYFGVFLPAKNDIKIAKSGNKSPWKGAYHAHSHGQFPNLD